MPSPEATKGVINAARRDDQSLDHHVGGTDHRQPDQHQTHFLPLTSDSVLFQLQVSPAGNIAADKAASQPRRFDAQLVEKSSRHVFGVTRDQLQQPAQLEEQLPAGPSSQGPESTPIPQRRRFSPQLVESSRRTRRAGDSKQLTPSERTDAPAIPSIDSSYFSNRFSSRETPTPPANTPHSSSPILTVQEARKLGIPLPKRSWSQSSTQSHHSYRPTELDTIQSSESDRSAPRSRRSSHSSRSSVESKHANPDIEGVDQSSSGCLLELAAKEAGDKLLEQALAAFPNDDRHQPISHYIDTATPSVSSRPSRSEVDRRQSTNWELQELQTHHAKLTAKKELDQKRRQVRRQLYKRFDEKPWEMPLLERHEEVDAGPAAPIATSNDEFECMRSKARPPMLGEDIKFPRCASPDGARFDVTQGPEFLKQQMCYLTSAQSEEPCASSGLWSPAKSEASQTSAWSRQVSRQTSTNCGLWGGLCLTSEQPKAPTGIMTPKLAEEDGRPHMGINPLPLLQRVLHLPPSPPPSNSGMSSLDDKLSLEEAIEQEFDDAFVTQVFNYVSLGYPAIAKEYDEELSKISRVPVEDLREDDHLPSARGYIRLGEEEQTDSEVTEERCARWRALKKYIHEWARQRPFMATRSPEMEGTWRKGSWGV
jgi:hypothetical protein